MKSYNQRKDDHLDLVLRSLKENGVFGLDLAEYSFEHNALPELDFSEVDTSVKFLGKRLKFPLIISSLTGGTEKSRKLNKALAELANDFEVGFSVGSQRVALEDDSVASTFKVRNFAPDVLLFANLGAVQLNYGYGEAECQKVVDMIEADALFLHLNPLQEVFQSDGNTNFSGLLKKIEKVCKKIDVPVFVKEVGYGISASVAQKLYEVGVKGVDVAGRGSYSWTEIEAQRSNDIVLKMAAQNFLSWGNSTPASIRAIASTVPSDFKIIASGGIFCGIDVAKAIALGANLCAAATSFLLKVDVSRSECENYMEAMILELKTAMFCSGSKTISDLKKAKLIKE